MKDYKGHFGIVALMGSGETTPSGGRIFEEVARSLNKPLEVAVLETPAGFELNSERVAGRVVDYIRKRLQNYSPTIHQIPARQQNGKNSTNDPIILEPIKQSNLIFMGPGSPTYTVRHLTSSLAWEMIRIRHYHGAALVLASAASIALGAYALPVYEIFKVGEDLHWKPGLDFFKVFGLSIVIIPHWNNQEGGKELDTSRCFMGEERFKQLCGLLPQRAVIMGIDEQTGVILDLLNGECRVLGGGKVHLVSAEGEEEFPAKSIFPLGKLGTYLLPEKYEKVFRNGLIRNMSKVNIECIPEFKPNDTVISLLRIRETARAKGDWQESDRIREMIRAEGWLVKDTPDGQVLERIKS